MTPSCDETFDFTATLTITGTITLRRRDHLLTEDGERFISENDDHFALELAP